MSDTAFWLLAAAFAAIGLGISVAKSWQRAADSLDPDTLAHLLDDPHICDVAGHRWVRDRHGRSCADCWEIETAQVYDVDLAPGTDLHDWQREMDTP